MAGIFLSVPILGKPELKFMYSMYQAILSCPQQHKVRAYFNENDSLISRVRNVHISTFLNEFTDCDYFMSIDSDIEILNAYHNNNIFSKLVADNLDFVGGLYALKKQGVRRSSSVSMDGSIPEYDSGLKEMKWLSSGCWCVKRSTVEKMVKAYPELIYDGDDSATGKEIYGLYMPMLYNIKSDDLTPEEEKNEHLLKHHKKYLSEDWSFCERWKAIGGKIYADTSIVLNHIGKKEYTLWDLKIVKSPHPLPPPAGFDLEKKNG